MGNFFTKQTAAGIAAALAMSALYRWYVGKNLGV